MILFPKQTKVLKHCLTLAIPDRDKSGSSIENSKVIQFLSKEMSRKFGGLRRSVEEGIYLSHNANLICEENTILKSWFADNQQEYAQSIIQRFLILLSAELNQETAAYWVDDYLYLVTLDDNNKTLSSSVSYSSLVVPRGRNCLTPVLPRVYSQKLKNQVGSAKS